MQTLIADFAARHVAHRPDLLMVEDFPADVWREMGKAGLFKIGISEMYGGSGGGYPELVAAGETFVKYGFNLGLAFSLAYQQIVVRYIIDLFGSQEFKRRRLPELAAGEITLSFAVSEPGHGAHPKLLKTRAIRRDHSFILDGEKTYLTNGPIADIFIVVAVTDDTTPRRRFTAFLVDRHIQGVTLMPPMAMNFLKTSPHGGIVLNSCILPPEAILGTEGNAWTEMVVPMGEIEDIVMMGPVLGGMEAQLDMLIASVATSASTAERELHSDIGNLHALLQTLRMIAMDAAVRLEKTGAASTPAGITFARLTSDFQNALAQCLTRWQVKLPDEHGILQQDMEFLGKLRKRLMQIRQEKIGAALLKPK